MNILFFSQLFDPENSIKGLEFVKRLEGLGHRVEVVTAFPSYPGGRIFSGYRQRWGYVEVIDGIKVTRVPTFVYHGKSALKRMISYASFGLMGLIAALIYAKRPHVIYAYYPPVVIGLAALLLGRVRSVPYVYDVQDLWPEALAATRAVAQGGRLYSLISRVCQIIYANAGKIVVLSNGYKRALIEKGVDPSKVVRIFNWCDESRISPVGSHRLPIFDVDYFNILYAGNLGPAQALGSVIEAAALIEKRGNSRIRFFILGSGTEEGGLKEKVRSLSLSNVMFLPRVSADDVGSYLTSADVLLVTLADDPVFEITIPQKIQAYLYAGRPLLVAVPGEASEIVSRANAGIAVEPCNAEKLAEAAMSMSILGKDQLEAMAISGRRYYDERLSMECGVKSVHEMLESLQKRRVSEGM